MVWLWSHGQLVTETVLEHSTLIPSPVSCPSWSPCLSANEPHLHSKEVWNLMIWHSFTAATRDEPRWPVTWSPAMTSSSSCASTSHHAHPQTLTLQPLEGSACLQPSSVNLHAPPSHSHFRRPTFPPLSSSTVPTTSNGYRLTGLFLLLSPNKTEPPPDIGVCFVLTGSLIPRNNTGQPSIRVC